MKRFLTSIAASLAILFAVPAIAFAHVVVTPNHSSIGTRVLFNVSVPNEKQVPVTSIKLDIPSSLQDVQPDVIAGWDIATATDSKNNVTSITWTGNVPVGQRADLNFKAQLPATAAQIDWKAYQTYADGTVVSWDQKPSASAKDDDAGTSGPYSVTKVTNDLNSKTSTNNSANNSSKTTLAFVFSIVALVLSAGSLFIRRRT
jgi:uncharacterized protein YcnI